MWTHWAGLSRRQLITTAFVGAGAALRPAWASDKLETIDADTARCTTGRALPPFKPLGPDLWLLPAATGDADAANRGHVSNLLLARHGRRLWLVGSGPSPAFGRALRCALRARWPSLTVALASPWPHPETVLGAAGLAPSAHWAHAEVAAQMAERCPHCVARLRERLDAASDDLGSDDPVRVPSRVMQGASGRLGPFRWWLLHRAADVAVTVWAHDSAGVVFAPGLLWDGRAPDGRDADLAVLAASTTTLTRLPGLPADVRWVGEQGGVQGRRAPRAAASYWRMLQATVDAALDRGDSGQTPVTELPGIAPAVTASPLHALNWQRAWRQAESRWLQRSLR